jgi:hypothetical protein
MSRQEVRQAVGDWVAAASIPHLNQIYTSHPKRINFEANSTAGEMTRAAGVVFISNETESRIAIGGASNGWKRIDYQVQFQVFTHSVEMYSQDAMATFDAIIDAIKTQLRAGGHRLGKTDGNIIWQAAEGGDTSISISYGEPLTNDGGATEIWASLDFVVTQMIQA